MKKSTFLFLLALFTFSTMFAQEKLGKLYDRDKANSLFGDVLEKVEVETSVLKDQISFADDIFLYNIENGKLELTNTTRRSMITGKTVKAKKVLFVAKVSVGLDLLRRGGAKVTTIERRASVTTITNGVYTLQSVAPCPPVCP